MLVASDTYDALAALAQARQVPVSVVAREALSVAIEREGGTAA